MAWVVLLLSGMLETVWAVALQASKGLSRPLPAVVQHLQVLQEAGLVQSEKVGRVRTCRLDAAALRRAEAWIADRRTGWERRLDRLGEYLEQAPGADPTQPRGSTS